MVIFENEIWKRICKDHLILKSTSNMLTPFLTIA